MKNRFTDCTWTAKGNSITCEFGAIAVTASKTCALPMSQLGWAAGIGTEEDAANARLIAASPDLLDVLIEMVLDYRHDRCDEKRIETINLAKAIIKKAGGEV